MAAVALAWDKHHRWSLDEPQIYQYHLGGALHPHIRWWEATDVPPRTIGFMEAHELTVASLVCEDLAQSDNVAEVIRSVGPTLLVTPLLDGPQLTSRWSARYASVFADDPGSAVCTLTSYGLVQRCRPPGLNPSPVVALWKAPGRGAREIPLEPGAQGVLLTACADRATPGWAEGVAEALAHAPERSQAVLADACPGTPWWAALGLTEPPPHVSAAIQAIAKAIRAVLPSDGAPSFDAVHIAAQEERPDEPELDRLARRVLLSTLEQLRARQAREGKDHQRPTPPAPRT